MKVLKIIYFINVCIFLSCYLKSIYMLTVARIVNHTTLSKEKKKKKASCSEVYSVIIFSP